MHGGFWRETWRREDTWKAKYNITLDLKERGGDGFEWIELAQDKDKWQSTEHGTEAAGSLKWIELAQDKDKWQSTEHGNEAAGSLKWIELAQDKDKWQSTEHGTEAAGSLKWGKFIVFLRAISFTKRPLFLGSIQLVS